MGLARRYAENEVSRPARPGLVEINIRLWQPATTSRVAMQDGAMAHCHHI